MKTVPSDPRLAEIDFSNAKPVSEVPALAKIQAERRQRAAEQAAQKPAFIEPDVWELIKQHADNAQAMARFHGVVRSLFI